MNDRISLKLSLQSYQRFEQLHQQFNSAHSQSLAQPLGAVLADISVEIIEQVFGEIARASTSDDQESEKVLQKILATLRKYMPWSVSLLGNERLTPMVNYLQQLIYTEHEQAYICYPVDHLLVLEFLECIQQMQQGNTQYLSPALKAFIQVVDQGVSCLIRQPKKILKFNLVVDKTLSGVIQLTTQLGYKRLEKLAMQDNPQTTQHYFEHFLRFLQRKPKSLAI